jgi:lipopolysaccharide export system protein LptC
LALAAEDIERRRRLLQSWRRHSALIRALRRALPTLGVAIILALAGLTAFNTLFLRHTPARQGALAIHLLNPRFEGRNEAGKPYLITAQSAVRDELDPAKVTLESPTFTLGATPADQTHLRGRRGVYREDTRMLDLTGAVILDDAQGYHFVTEHALINMGRNDVDGDRPVEGRGPLGQIAASSYAVRNGGARVFFTGHVRSHIESRGMSAAGFKSTAPAGAQPKAR